MRFALSACFAALAILFNASIAVAAGALATGQCGAFGYSSNDASPEAASLRARAQCKGRDCRVVTSFHNICAAFSVDARNFCGPHAWAQAATLAEAQTIASEQCQRHGGRTCVIRAWVCDQKG